MFIKSISKIFIVLPGLAAALVAISFVNRVPVTGVEERPYIMDSATRSYIAWGEALQAAGKLGESGACSNTTQENIFAGISNNLDSATRSYIAWGLALQAKNNLHACH